MRINEILEPGSKPDNSEEGWKDLLGLGLLLVVGGAAYAGAMFGLGWVFYDGHIGIRGWSKNFQWANEAIGIAIWAFAALGFIVGGIKGLWNTYRWLRKRLDAARG